MKKKFLLLIVLSLLLIGIILPMNACSSNNPLFSLAALSTPQNVRQEGQYLKWNNVRNAEFYGLFVLGHDKNDWIFLSSTNEVSIYLNNLNVSWWCEHLWQPAGRPLEAGDKIRIRARRSHLPEPLYIIVDTSRMSDWSNIVVII